MEVLSIRNSDLLKNEDASVLLSKINLSVDSGEIVLLSGVNGAGKSTLLKALLNFSVSDDSEYASLQNGSLELCGTTRLDDINTKVIYIDQKDEPGKESRTAEKILLDGLPDSIRNKKVFLHTWLDKYKALTEDDIKGGYNTTEGKIDKPLLKKRFMALSGGQRKWICLLQGLVKSDVEGYKIALIDEPLNNLDAKHIMQFSDLLLRITSFNQEFCFLIVSHCHAFTKIAKLYMIENNGLVRKEYLNHNCFGSYDEDGFYRREMNPKNS